MCYGSLVALINVGAKLLKCRFRVFCKSFVVGKLGIIVSNKADLYVSECGGIKFGNGTVLGKLGNNRVLAYQYVV